MKTTACLLLLSALLLTQCQLFKKDPPSPLEQLPAATQEGKNTFGCLVNGQAWTPRGRIGLSSNYSVDYDPSYQGGTFDLRVYRTTDQSDGTKLTEYLWLGMDSLSQAGTYSLNSPNIQANQGVGQFAILQSNPQGQKVICDYTYEEQIQRTGNLVITRLDIKQGIVAGTFDFTLAKPGCDTIRVTQGRFDKKL